jgi:serine/threonine protein kinase
VTLAPASRIGTNEIVAPLGAGGMGEVYRGRDTGLGHVVALKVLRPSLFPSDTRIRGLTWSHDGKALIIGRQRRNGDLVLMDLAK